jgi:hypothetical protein
LFSQKTNAHALSTFHENLFKLPREVEKMRTKRSNKRKQKTHTLHEEMKSLNEVDEFLGKQNEVKEKIKTKI